MAIKSGDYIILDSNVCFMYSMDSPFEIEVNYDDAAFTIMMVFTDNGGERVFQRKVDVENNIITFECTNFGTGAGTVEPVLLGAIDNKKMFIHLWVYTESNNSVRKVEYTIFVEK